MIERFEDLIAWQKARSWTARLYRVSGSGVFGKDFGLKDQLRRASVSILSNLAEGFERRHRKEFCQFVMIAKASCAEARAQLYVALDIEYISPDQFAELMTQGEEIGRLLGGLAKSLQRPLK